MLNVETLLHEITAMRRFLRFILTAGLAACLIFGTWFGYTYARFYALPGPSEEVRIASGDIALAGTLLMPQRDGPVPGVVMLHGAGPGARGDPAYRAHARLMRDAGFAVLLYDKRGSGKSGGEFARDDYAGFIADAEAALAWLKARPGIDAARVGLFGASESGWFVPGIARRGGAAFALVKSGSPLSWIDTVEWENRNDLIAAGRDPASAKAEAAALSRVWRLMAAGETQALGPALEALRQSRPNAEADYAGLFEAAASADVADHVRRQRTDPRPDLEALGIPLFYVFGETDTNVPTVGAAAYLDRLAEDSGRDITVLVLRDVGHALYSWRGLLRGGYPPAYFRAVRAWLAEKVPAG